MSPFEISIYGLCCLALGTLLGVNMASKLTACDDCGSRLTRLAEKGDHHGGTKNVCVDRDGCHVRRPN